jgi:quinol---cytochrome-c reductase cytochrome c subunit
MRRAAILLGLIGALLVLAPAAPAEPPPPGLYTAERDGKALYGANCSSCHGSNGRGVVAERRGPGDQPALGPPLRGVGALAADFYLRTGYMPLASPYDQPWRSRVLFTDAQIRALVAYVASLGPGPRVPRPRPERGNVSRGLRLFTDHCAGCHQVVAAGGALTGARVPPLDQATDTQVAEAVRIGPYLMPRFSKRQISDRQLDDLVAYVDYAKHPRDEGGWAVGHVGPVPEGIVTWLVGAVVLVLTCMVVGRRLRA